MIFQCEKAMKDMEGKISDSEKADINTKIEALKNELKSGTTESIKAKQEELEKSFYAVSQKMYEAAAQQAQQQGAAPDMGGAPAGGSAPDGVVDADFTEVNDDK